MSRLRNNPQKHKCHNWLGKRYSNNDFVDLGFCGDLAVIRCNACKNYFCQECWEDHLHMTIVEIRKDIKEEIK